MYFLTYIPASCFVTYILLQQLHGRFSPAATFAVAAAMVLFGVELRAALRRRLAGKDR